MSSASPSRSRPERSPSLARGAAREEAILNAAVGLLAEVGYDRITVDQIAARAGASKATMYRRWSGKAELIGEALRRHAEAGEVDAIDAGSLRSDLLAAMKGMTRTITGQDGPALAGLVGVLRGHSDLRTIVDRQIQGACRTHASEIVDRAVARGEIVTPPIDPAEVLGLALAQLLFHTLMTGSPPTARAQTHLVDSVLIPLLAPELPRPER